MKPYRTFSQLASQSQTPHATAHVRVFERQAYNYQQRDFFLALRERQWQQQRHFLHMKRYASMLKERQYAENSGGRTL